ncbi:hypothetical protein H5392_01360 [Tessaracoccus sp. MC1865]|uniref:hypothetical protein n=1 Tax=Tessaracoccus sp. MC1865 TaxID=2760310 RepID=UPI0016006C45|nr:hypothetical protein [Tessaracoccus sp. MC1865]MBB1482505.1 hypothetical protein [Tessaracoccus sp. MC1865]QTO38040.1 hypothetical protein J7D54_02730 [Tessaracoccus sp. MC1865]
MTSPHGYQPSHRYQRSGRLKFHAVGCWVDGGAGLPRGVCEKCAESPVDEYLRSLMRVDRRAKAA